MAYLVNQCLPQKLYIGGRDYTSQLLSFQVSDSSAFRNGIITTAGSIELTTTLQETDLDDYDRSSFKRGNTVQLDMVYSNGYVERHPRGFLYVMSTSYDPESNNLSVEVGCELALRRLTDQVDALLSYAEVPLDPAQQTFEGLSSSIAAAGKCMWADRYGQLRKAQFFNDTPGNTETGKWVSIKGVTALKLSPMSGGKAIPDAINLSYQFPESSKSTDGTGRQDIVQTSSTYYLRYPAPTFKRTPAPGSNIGTIVSDPIRVTPGGSGSGGSSTCGNAPPPPTTVGGGTITITIPPSACSSNYETVEDAVYLPANRQETSVTLYEAPGAQVSRIERLMYGPRIEANSQYFADAFSYCRGLYATACNPMGGCPFDGMDSMLLGRNVTENTYGSANELIKTVTFAYRPILAAAQTTDWRSGIVNGIPQDFNQNLKSTNTMYLHQKTIAKFRKDNNANIQETITYTSTAARGSGVEAGYYKLDATRGVKTTEIRRSVTIGTTDLRPDAVNAATTVVETGESRIPLSNAGGFATVAFAGPYILDESVPVPLLYDSKSEVNNALAEYELYIQRFIEGDSRGLQVGESLRRSIARSWTPNMPFRYYDPYADEYFAYRMDATSWTVTSSGSALATSAIWVDNMSGRPSIPDNLVGNGAPIIDTPTLPPLPDPEPGVPPWIEPQPEPGENGPDEPDDLSEEPDTPDNEPEPDPDEDIIDRIYRLTIDVPMYIEMHMQYPGSDGVRPIPELDVDVYMRQTLVTWCGGSVTEPGALVNVDGDGGVLLTDEGDMIVDSDKIVIEDLFA